MYTSSLFNIKKLFLRLSSLLLLHVICLSKHHHPHYDRLNGSESKQDNDYELVDTDDEDGMKKKKGSSSSSRGNDDDYDYDDDNDDYYGVMMIMMMTMMMMFILNKLQHGSGL
jgi:uncharacterized protein YxeA